MTDFGDMIREALTGGAPFRAEPGLHALEAAMARFDGRARWMRRLVALALVMMTALTALGLFQLVHARADDTRMIGHGVILAVAGFTGIAFSKLWFMLHQNHLVVMRELKGLEYLVLRQSGDRSA